VSLGSTARDFARRLLPPAVRRPLARIEQRLNAVRFTIADRERTGYRVRFDYKSVRKAKAVILWHDDWERATNATLEVIERLDLVHDGDLVVDYGCGIGRITRSLRQKRSARVLAVDRSPAMRAHARDYLPAADLESGQVELLSDLDLLQGRPELTGAVDCVLLIEVAQHVPEAILDDLLPRLAALLAPDGRIFALGNDQLDVDRQGDSGSPIEPVLARHLRILRRDRWTEGFAYPRHSFVCARLQD
jgi:cyclopropane fatty-acyl-phospholipid synthase-like methyltransferase